MRHFGIRSYEVAARDCRMTQAPVKVACHPQMHDQPPGVLHDESGWMCIMPEILVHTSSRIIYAR
jgi:hypothetical protein